MAEKTYEEGVIEGRIEALEKISANNVAVNEGLRKDLTSMGESIRNGFVAAVTALKNDIKDDLRVQIEPIVSELRGNGQPGLIKRFENYKTTAKANWALTLLIVAAIITKAFNVW